MNRASRIASSASSGQVLCSRDLYDAATALSVTIHGSPEQLPFSAISLGASTLKGLPDPVELLLCRPEALSPSHLPVGISVPVSEPSNSEQQLLPPLPPLQQPQPQPQQQQQQQRQRQLQVPPPGRLQESQPRPIHRLSAQLRVEPQGSAAAQSPGSAASDAPLHVATPRVSLRGLLG
ncbi:hypothetical protein Vretimale_12837, partial [Volvox reticuliferus]